MKSTFALKLATLGVLMAGAGWSAVPDVKATTPRTRSGERVVRIETTLRPSPETTWKAFSTEEGLRCWAAPLVRLDLRTGGSLETNYDKAAGIGGPGTISLRILNYVEGEVLTFKAELNDSFSERLRAEDDRLQEVVQLQRLPNGGTRVVSSMVGGAAARSGTRPLTSSSAATSGPTSNSPNACRAPKPWPLPLGRGARIFARVVRNGQVSDLMGWEPEAVAQLWPGVS
jgi:uncharacterized protein YndB with AHSA1/START domain